MCTNKGFTLVEILIVVVILGILAAIVVPQFSEASDEARTTSLSGDLQTVRTQIGLYRVHHGMFPGFTRGADGTLSAWDAATFAAQLAGKTDVNGDTSGTDYGPYLQQFPENPYTATPNQPAGVKEGDPDGADTGWTFNTATGKFWANDASAAHQAL
jgi:general secretion pathway protein G